LLYIFFNLAIEHLQKIHYIEIKNQKMCRIGECPSLSGIQEGLLPKPHLLRSLIRPPTAPEPLNPRALFEQFEHWFNAAETCCWAAGTRYELPSVVQYNAMPFGRAYGTPGPPFEYR